MELVPKVCPHLLVTPCILVFIGNIKLKANAIVLMQNHVSWRKMCCITHVKYGKALNGYERK
jgi:hypothetical protein